MKKFDDRWPGTNWDQEDLDDMETFEKIRHPEAAFMPTSGQRIARHSSHMTDGSRRASRDRTIYATMQIIMIQNQMIWLFTSRFSQST